MYQYVSLFQMFESRIFVEFYTKLHLVLRALHRCTDQVATAAAETLRIAKQLGTVPLRGSFRAPGC